MKTFIIMKRVYFSHYQKLKPITLFEKSWIINFKPEKGYTNDNVQRKNTISRLDEAYSIFFSIEPKPLEIHKNA